MSTWIIIKFDSGQRKLVGGVSLTFEIFAPIRSHVNENEKKKNRDSLEIWWLGSCPQNLVWIHAAVYEKPEFKDDGRMRHDSSSADKVKQS